MLYQQSSGLFHGLPIIGGTRPYDCPLGWTLWQLYLLRNGRIVTHLDSINVDEFLSGSYLLYRRPSAPLADLR